MDYGSQHGLLCTGRKMMVILLAFFLWCSASAESPAALLEGEISGKNQSRAEISKSEITKREEPEAQRRDHSFNADGTVNYHGSGSGHDSGDLVPPPGGGIFNSLSIKVISSPGPSGLSNSYGAPIPSDSYGPPKNIFDDIKPPSGSYGPPSPQYGPPNNKYLPPPKPVYGPPKIQYRPPSPKPVYGPPSGGPQFGPPKSTYGPPKGGRPKPSFVSRPKPVYGPPKQSFGGGGGFSHGTLLTPVGNIKSQYGPPKISATYGTPLQPSISYGAPKHPKGGRINAPPTPPVVKYDGWKPIPGLVSNPPSSSYGAPESGGHGFDFSSVGQISGTGFDSIAPPSGSSFGVTGSLSSAYGAPSFGGSSFGFSGFGIQLQPSTSYGPPPKPSPSYGTPLQPSTSYGPPSGGKGPSKLNFLSAVKSPSFSYGLPEPSLAPSPPKPSSSYGPPKPSSSYGPPKPSSSYGPPKAPSISYGPPQISGSFGPPKPPGISYGPPKSPSGSYGPPKPPSSSYGPPSVPVSSYGPPTSISSSFTPPKPGVGSFIPPKAPSVSYGPPKVPSSSYGPPKPPSGSYGPPQVFTTYSIPKPSISIGTTQSTAYRGPSIPHPLQPPSTYGVPSFSGGLYKTPLPPNALYGVPTAPAPPLFDAGFHGPSSNFGAPFTDLHAPVAPVPSIDIGSQFASTGSGPLFPSTSYGTPVVPSTQSTYQPPANTYGAPTALPLRQPKNPVKFRPPVPPGLISSIGAKWGDSAAWGGNAHSNKFHGNTYIPPAVPDPDPGIQANKGNPLVIPPPPAPPINYGPPSSGGHNEGHQISNSFVSPASVHSSAEGDLNPPPPPHGHGNFDIQQSASVELPSSNNLDQQVNLNDNANYFPPEGVTNYNAPIDTSHHQSGGASSNQDFSNGVHIKGNQGSYTLQIQAAGGNSGEHVPHSEVLSNGLLQDILTAIENPSASGKLEQYTGPNDPVGSEIGINILKQLGGTDAQQSNSIQLPSQYGSDLSHASSNNIPLVSKNPGWNNEILSVSQSNVTGNSGQTLGKYLNQNDVAFYYKSQEEEGVRERKKDENDEKDVFLVQMLLPNNSTSADSQSSEFGGLVSIKLQNAQNVWGVESRNSTVTSNDAS